MFTREWIRQSDQSQFEFDSMDRSYLIDCVNPERYLPDYPIKPCLIDDNDYMLIVSWGNHAFDGYDDGGTVMAFVRAIDADDDGRLMLLIENSESSEPDYFSEVEQY